MERRRFWNLFFAAAGLIVLYCVLQKLSVVGEGITWVFGILSPIFVGFILAFVLNLPMRGLEKLWDTCELGIKRSFAKRRNKKANKALHRSLGLIMEQEKAHTWTQNERVPQTPTVNGVKSFFDELNVT